MPMHTRILENIHALLDCNQVSRLPHERIKLFSEMFSLALEESTRVLNGEQVPNKTLLKNIADKFEVDARWLLTN